MPCACCEGDPASGPAVEGSGLTRAFGDVRAVDGVELSVPAGSFYGLAGPNGADKTTAIRMITGLLQPEAGAITVDGIAVWPDPNEAKRRLGFVPDNPKLFDRLTAAEMLQYAGLLHGMGPETIALRSEELLRVLDLVSAADRVIADVSLGMTKRIGLAVALLHAPRVLILDEPFGSLDPVNTEVMEAMLQRYRSGGGTVVFSSHVMDVVERLCDRVAIIANGIVVAEGTVPELAPGGSLQAAFVELVGGHELGEEDLG